MNIMNISDTKPCMGFLWLFWRHHKDQKSCPEILNFWLSNDLISVNSGKKGQTFRVLMTEVLSVIGKDLKKNV